MAPFFAAAIYFHARLLDSQALRFAILADTAAGLAFLAKYAAVHFLLGIALGAVLVPAMRLSARQFAVFGPGLFAAMLWAARKWANWRLLVFAIPTIAIVCLQALLDRAFANWAAAGYFAGTIAAVAVLAAKPGLTTASLAINGAIALILPPLTLMPGLTLGRSEPLLSR